ncbi:MAG TPA: mechanosensitive ion channel [Candidatus Aminicenantes bacterium]|nr:mechanosensitive ion channel [Candidatus Aminicenantes bacterium]
MNGHWIEWLQSLIPMLVLLAVTASLWRLLKTWFSRREEKYGRQAAFSRQLTKVFMTVAVVTGIIATAPVSGEIRGQLLGFWGILISATLALSATTFLGNLLAGFMLRTVGGFSAGDFICVDEHFGRVTERGVFHVEIQTEESQLVMLPNILVASRPTRIMHSRGTLVSCSLSLGYDLHRLNVEPVLIEAAKRAGLEEAFVRITELGNFAVTYRVSGLLREVKTLISSRSKLHAFVLDSLHEAGMEIVSPTFMNQRRLEASPPVIPKKPMGIKDKSEEKTDPEQLIFAKAEAAHKLESLVEGIDALKERINALEEDKKAADEEQRSDVDSRIQRMHNWLHVLEDRLKEKRMEIDNH